ncbi:MAG TPA: serine/threonine-protein kinase [Thermoanaerobaculia bacterium]|nr:serine/threonine-protein kinase [Thermoanaerobaculia bacterium]
MTADAKEPAGEAPRWQRVKDLFAAALERPAGERPGFLADACGSDRELAAEVASLLDAHDDAGTFLETPAAAPATTPPSGSVREPEPPPERLGPYRLLSEIGHGGMGTVYLAERDDDAFRKRVAVKLIKRGMNSDEIVRRFRTERQILAALEHPAVARLLDGGAAPDGRPYVVMEHVEGEPIDRHCRRQGLDSRQRLRLFLRVAAAVAAAHRALVVHRDIKPSNILVNADGDPKLLDFGIAKLLAPGPAGGEAAETAAFVRPMTLDSASPEQVRGEAITTATDVWGLGVLLYRLLTDRHPFAEHLDAAPHRLAQAITEEDPPPPSRVADLPAGTAGDLDAILLTALARDPKRRYASVERLTDDLRRHLDGRPVVARTPTLAYRLGKLARRHKVATALVLSALLFTSAVTWQRFEIARQRDQAEIERVRAETLSEFLVGLFEVSDPEVARGDEVRVREVLDAGADRLLGGQPLDRPGSEPGVALGELPESRADLLLAVGAVYSNLGLLDRAETLLAAAVELRRQVAPPGELALALAELGAVQRRHGDRNEALASYGEALDLQERHLAEGHPDLAPTLTGLAFLREEEGDLEKAESLLRRAVDIRRTHPGPGDRDLAASLNDLGVLALHRREPEVAEPLLAEARELHRRLYGDDHPRTAVDLANLAGLLHRQGEYQRAADRMEEALDIQRRTLGDAHPTLALTLANLGALRYETGDLGAARTALTEALAVHRRLGRDDHPDVARTLEALAAVLRQEGDLAAAEPVYRRALAMARRLHPAGHPRIANTANNLGLLLRDRGELAEAEALLAEALATRRTALGENDPATALSLHSLGTVRSAAGDPAGAEALFRRALDIRREALPERHPHLAYTLLALGELLTADGRAGEAEALLAEAVEVRRAALAPGHWRTAEAESAYGDCLAELGRHGEAEALLVAAHRRLAESRGADSEEARLAAARLARHGFATTP